MVKHVVGFIKLMAGNLNHDIAVLFSDLQLLTEEWELEYWWKQ
jgi:hypothetical protein